MQFGNSHSFLFVFAVVIQKSTLSSQKPKQKPWKHDDCFYTVYRCLYASVGYHTTDRPKPYTAGRPEGAGKHACLQGIPNFLWRIKRYASSFDVTGATIIVTGATERRMPFTLLLA